MHLEERGPDPRFAIAGAISPSDGGGHQAADTWCGDGRNAGSQKIQHKLSGDRLGGALIL